MQAAFLVLTVQHCRAAFRYRLQDALICPIRQNNLQHGYGSSVKKFKFAAV